MVRMHLSRSPPGNNMVSLFTFPTALMQTFWTGRDDLRHGAIIAAFHYFLLFIVCNTSRFIQYAFQIQPRCASSIEMSCCKDSCGDLGFTSPAPILLVALLLSCSLRHQPVTQRYRTTNQPPFNFKLHCGFFYSPVIFWIKGHHRECYNGWLRIDLPSTGFPGA